jgi:hypothetical protein
LKAALVALAEEVEALVILGVRCGRTTTLRE